MSELAIDSSTYRGRSSSSSSNNIFVVVVVIIVVAVVFVVVVVVKVEVVIVFVVVVVIVVRAEVVRTPTQSRSTYYSRWVGSVLANSLIPPLDVLWGRTDQ